MCKTDHLLRAFEHVDKCGYQAAGSLVGSDERVDCDLASSAPTPEEHGGLPINGLGILAREHERESKNASGAKFLAMTVDLLNASKPFAKHVQPRL